MSIEEIPLATTARVVAGVVGAGVLAGGLVSGFLLAQSGSYLFAAASVAGGITGARVFVGAAIRGTSPRWRAHRFPRT